MNIKKILLTSLMIVVALKILSFVPQRENIIPISGENQFSFSYSGHLSWILKDWIDHPQILFQSHK